MELKVIDKNDFLQTISESEKDAQRNYGAMYSSWLKGVVKDPNLMLIPIDDHMVHRGDAVFEAFKYVYGAFYDIDSHLKRMRHSAELISLNIPYSDQEIIKICQFLIKESGLKESVLRLYVSRGPGDFSPNPYSTVGSQLYIVATPLSRVDEEKYQKGCKLIRSDIPVKPSFYSKVKSCNYMQNVLMKKYSIDKDVDFAVNFNDHNFLCEGPTENILILTQDKKLIAPKYEYTLKGTTLEIVMSLARELIESGEVVSVSNENITENELINAAEVMMVGTTLEVISVVEYNNEKIGSGVPGEISRLLRNKLIDDMKTSSVHRTI